MKLSYSEDTRRAIGQSTTYCVCVDDQPGEGHWSCEGHTNGPYLYSNQYFARPCRHRNGSFCMLSEMNEVETVYHTPKNDLLLLVGRLLTEAGTKVLAKRFEEDS